MSKTKFETFSLNKPLGDYFNPTKTYGAWSHFFSDLFFPLWAALLLISGIGRTLWTLTLFLPRLAYDSALGFGRLINLFKPAKKTDALKISQTGSELSNGLSWTAKGIVLAIAWIPTWCFIMPFRLIYETLYLKWRGKLVSGDKVGNMLAGGLVQNSPEKQITAAIKTWLHHWGDVNEEVILFTKGTALHKACEKRLPEVVKLLLANGADVTKKDKKLYSKQDRDMPLHTICKVSKGEEVDLTIIKSLLEKHEDNTKLQEPNNKKMTPLDLIIFESTLGAKTSEIIQAILNKIDPNSVEAVKGKTLQCLSMRKGFEGNELQYLIPTAKILISDESIKNTTDGIAGSTPLHTACRAHKSMNFIQFLTNKGANWTAKNEQEYTPFRFLVAKLSAKEIKGLDESIHQKIPSTAIENAITECATSNKAKASASEKIDALLELSKTEAHKNH